MAVQTLRRSAAWPGWLIYALSFGIGLGTAVDIFGLQVLLGTAEYWDSPHGIVGGSANDMLTSLSGYDTFVRDSWRWPLLRVEGMGGPGGTNIAFVDGAPGLALIGRAIFRLTGSTPVLFGVWTAGCFVLMATASTGLVRRLGGRSVAAGVAAAAIGVSMPALLARWGHNTLMAQGLIPLVLVAYLNVVAGMKPLRAFALMLALCLLSILTIPYLFFMTIAVALAGLGQAGLRKVVPLPQTVLACSGLIGSCLLALFALGHLTGGLFADRGFGVFSMNLLSPFVPQVSGLFPGARGMVDATGGQYEGFVYLGFGLILLIALAAPELRQRLPGRVRRHALLSIVLAVSVALAVSNKVYAGSLLLLSFPVPEFLSGVTGIVRSSGRLAWIALYLGAALAVATIARWRLALPLLLGASLLQWMDAGAFRASIRESVAGPFSTIDRIAWTSAMPFVSRIAVDPPFLCIGASPDQDAMQHAAAEIQLKAAQADVPNNSVYAARTRPDCTLPPISPGMLWVAMRPDGFRPDFPCASGTLLTVCHDRLGLAILTALATTTTRSRTVDGP